MPFREKLRKTFSRNSTAGQNDEHRESIHYQPGEKIPYKYRRPVAKEHQDKLESFSFSNAWRRMSHVSQYSPMASRQGSVTSAVRRSIGGRRQNSCIGPMGEDYLDVTMTDAGRSDSQKENMDPRAGPIKHDSPFSTDDLSMAMQKSHLQVPS